MFPELNSTKFYLSPLKFRYFEHQNGPKGDAMAMNFDNCFNRFRFLAEVSTNLQKDALFSAIKGP